MNWHSRALFLSVIYTHGNWILKFFLLAPCFNFPHMPLVLPLRVKWVSMVCTYLDSLPSHRWKRASEALVFISPAPSQGHSHPFHLLQVHCSHPPISLKGLLNFNWNEEVKTLCSFLKNNAMHLSGLGASPNSCRHSKSLIAKHERLGTILHKYKQFEWQIQNYTIGGKKLSSQNIESNDSFQKIKCSKKHQGTRFQLQLA